MRISFLSLLLILPCPALACSLCGGVQRQSLAERFEQAQIVAYGHVANPKLNPDGISGTSEFHIEKIVKDHPAFPRDKMIVVPRYLPVFDAKNPPRQAMFFKVPAKTPELQFGVTLTSPAVLDFIGRLAAHAKDPAGKVQFAVKHLDDADPIVAEEAFLVLAQADDKLIARIAKDLPAPLMRKLVQTPDLEPERLGLYAYLLGACGNGDDVETFRKSLKDPSGRKLRAYDGIIAGYISLRPKEGWAFAHNLLKDPMSDFTLRYASLQAMRFFYNANADENGPNVMVGAGLALTHPDLGDIAIRDLAKWKRWDHTKAIVSAYEVAKSPIAKSNIVRYALACPLPEARALVDRVRRQDPQLVKYLEEELK